MRNLLFFVLTLLTTPLCGQNGYVKLMNDSVIVGYLKYYNSARDGHQGIELWRTKKDKSPLRITKEELSEYAIKGDTFKVLHQFKPFPEAQAYFEVVDARLKSSGKVNLYIIENYQSASRVSTYTGGGLIPALIDESTGNLPYIYVVEDKKINYLKALPAKKAKLQEVLMDFFPERYILKYAEVKGEIDYKAIPDLVQLYNSR